MSLLPGDRPRHLSHLKSLQVRVHPLYAVECDLQLQELSEAGVPQATQDSFQGGTLVEEQGV